MAIAQLPGKRQWFLLVRSDRRSTSATVAIISLLRLSLHLQDNDGAGRGCRANTSTIESADLSTIETLAMAIDAKDQVTNGHIRRVQTHEQPCKAGRRARREAAQSDRSRALLHDMGKLAVPGYILNKAWKANRGGIRENETYASVGATSLSNRFSVPVVPSFRHHHENWDGRTAIQPASKELDIPMVRTNPSGCRLFRRLDLGSTVSTKTL